MNKICRGKNSAEENPYKKEYIRKEFARKDSAHESLSGKNNIEKAHAKHH